ncbi:MAG: hypothetical protein E6K39_10590 [Gammaproteobacteria bacterium]|nr:MAG: hypothetical protein E6K39_10590 [Gammaproteobacteria bacterium]
MSPGEKRARRRERDRAAYARDPEKFRKLSRENRLKPGAAERHMEYAKAWALRNAERVKALRKANYENNRQINIEKTRAWKKRNPARVLASQRSRATINGEKNRAARKAWEERNPTAALESFKRYRERNRAKIRARLAVSKQGREKRRALWANQDAILAIYLQAEIMTRPTGRLHVVDHIIPLQGRTVSGLHVETNLRVVEHHENARKHNAWESPGWQRPGDEAAPVAVPRQGSLF